MDLVNRIKEGLEGKYSGLNNGFDSLNKYIFGLQRKCYMLLGGASGTFKTTLVDFMLFNALKDAEEKGVEFNVFYYSFEIDKLNKQCNWLSNHIYNKYNVVIPPERIKGLGNNRLSPTEQELINEEIPYIERLFDKINFTFIPTHPTKIFITLKEFAKSKGEMLDNNTYQPYNKNAFNIVIVDHIYLLHKEQGLDTKKVLDIFSEYCVILRNIYGYSMILLQQFNDGLSTVERQKYKGVDLSPQQSDFKDTRNTYQDADIVLGTMNPYKLDMDECLGYDINEFKEKFLMLKVVKNRLSKDGIAAALYVNPAAGNFKELPPASDFRNNYGLYKQYT